MGKKIELTGKRFGFWIAVEEADKNSRGQTQWLCKCDCGTIKTITTNSLRTGNSTSCGCNHAPDLTGQKFGQLLVLGKDESKEKTRRYWQCKCDCNNIITVSTYNLRNNKVFSCGCELSSPNKVVENVIDHSNILEKHTHILNKLTSNVKILYDRAQKINDAAKIIRKKINKIKDKDSLEDGYCIF